MVRVAEPLEEGVWRVRLGLRVGPLDVGRDLRMRRVAPLRFERDEPGHSAVVIEVAIEDTTSPADEVGLTLSVRIDKRIPLLDLRRELSRRSSESVRRLQVLVDEAQAAAEP